MAYTQTDADNVRAAILALSTGTRKASITFSSAAGSRTVQYANANLADLRSLLELIEGELENAATPRSRTVLTRSRKGL